MKEQSIKEYYGPLVHLDDLLEFQRKFGGRPNELSNPIKVGS